MVKIPSFLNCCCCCSFLADKGFTSNVTCAIVGHWSKDSFHSNHFNALLYSSRKSSTCSHSKDSMEELLRQLLLLLSFLGQTVVEFFPRFACGKK